DMFAVRFLEVAPSAELDDTFEAIGESGSGERGLEAVSEHFEEDAVSDPTVVDAEVVDAEAAHDAFDEGDARDDDARPVGREAWHGASLLDIHAAEPVEDVFDLGAGDFIAANAVLGS